MIDSVVGVVLLCLVLLLLLSRFKTSMAALMAWIVSSITGEKNKKETALEGGIDTEKSVGKNKSKQKGTKSRQRLKKNYEEPAFNTNLLTPIEDIIEETITEETKPEDLQASSSRIKGGKKNKISLCREKEEDKDKFNQSSKAKGQEEDSIGYSFFSSRIPEVPKNEKRPKKTSDFKVVEVETPIDDVGFSFIPAKEKTKKNRKDNKQTVNIEIEQGNRKAKESILKSSIVDHYKVRGKKQTVLEPVPVVTNKFVNNLEKVQNFVADNNCLEEKTYLEGLHKTEHKESKKVCSNISYASIVNNKVTEENTNFSEVNRKEIITYDVISKNNKVDTREQVVTESRDTNQTFHTSNLPVFSNCENILAKNNSEKKSHLTKSEQNSIITQSIPADLTGNFSNLIPKCNSSPIEVLNEAQSENNDYLSVNEKSAQFETIAKSNTQSEVNIHSSICDSINKLLLVENPENKYITINHNSVNEETFCLTTTKDSFIDSQIDFEAIEPDEISGASKREFSIDEKEAIDKSKERPYLQFDLNTGTSFSEITNDFISVEKSSNYTLVKNNTAVSESLSQKLLTSRQPLESSFDFLEDSNKSSNSRSCDLFQKSEKNLTSDTYKTNKTFEQIEDIIKSPVSSQAVSNLETNQYSTSNLSNDCLKNKIDGDTITSPIDIESKSNGNIQIDHYSDSQDLGKLSLKDTFDILQIPFKTSAISDNKTSAPENIQSVSKAQEHIDSSSKFIDEEKCIKKTAYITGGPLENKTKLLDNNDLHIVDLESQILSEESFDNISSKHQKMATPQQIRVMTLNDQEHQECTLYRIEKNWVIQFRLGPSLFGRKVYLYCNYPHETSGKSIQFNRSQYQLLEWEWDEGCKNADDTAAYTQITAKLAGSFHYYFTYEKGLSEARHGSGYFLVDPVLKYGNNEDLPLDCVQCQTVLTKGLGSFSTWEKKLQVAKESGYNMIHFTPIQELGGSNSSYSLSEQLKVNSIFKKENGEIPTFEEIEKFTSKIRKEWKVTSICDIVLNHTANESQWIKEHTEVTYNCKNCPYMRPAYLLDAACYQFSLDVKKGVYEDRGIPSEINHEDHLNAIRYHFRISVLDVLKIHEFYICDINKYVAEFLKLARTVPPVTFDPRTKPKDLNIQQDPEYRRLCGKINIDLALQTYNVYWSDTFDEESRLKRCAAEFKNKLDFLNNAIIDVVNGHLNAAVDNILAGIRYFRVQADGPRLKEISLKNPLVDRYFTDFGHPKSIKEHEEIMYSSNGQFLMAHNGWVMNSDPLKNFAAPDSNVYFRRELIAWGDSVKLRFGDKPEDCPFLWEYMRKYVEQTAKIFDGVRLDNCHSTPIPVAEYLLDCARRVKPDLYVVAELFTNSDMTDNIFVNRLGITSLIREAMSAWDSHEEGRLVYRYGGYPVGAFHQPMMRPLVPSVAHALFLDLTHDNPSPIEKRSVFDLLPSTALVNMACCASGSNRGYDELVPHHIHVVDETRQYTEWTGDEKLATESPRYVSKASGIIAAKKAINDLHFTLGKKGFKQVYVDQMDPDIVAVTRHCPQTHQSYILVAFTAFGHPNKEAENHQRYIKPLRVEGNIEEIVLEATLSHSSVKSGGSKFTKPEKFLKDGKWINGLAEYQVNLKEHIQVVDSDVFEKVNSGSSNVTQLNFKNFKPGSVAVVRVSLPEAMQDAIKQVRNLIETFSSKRQAELPDIIGKMTLADLNRALYRCDQEERDEGYGFDTYNIPNSGPMVYAGLQGFMSLLANIRPNNDLGHPMCANLRDGNWMIEYIWKRLKLDDGTRNLGQWIEENTKCFSNIPRYLVPCYFDVVVTGIYILLMEQCFKLMSNFVTHGSTFVRSLSLGSVQFGAYIKSADLPTLSPNLAPPKPPTRKNNKGELNQACVTLSAGLPHFTVGYMRNWGRDTFIAMRGTFILTGRYEEARQHILGYAACLRHGLIPNLLDGGRNSRFNCRDAVWWWLHCIKEYAEEAPNGINILKDKVCRIFPTDESPPQPAGSVDQPLHDVMQEALKVHFQGLAFRERNAGRQIDEHMTDRGFNNQIGVHPETGFVFGGNEWNCGTWMDKMGSSDKAGNRGKPATPRDGSAVELVGLSKAVVIWLWRLSQEKKYPYSGVERTHKNGTITKWTFKEWSDRIQANFEKYFWVNTAPTQNEIRPDLINKRGIYKDSNGATQEWTDFQLRCNFPIVMVVAPELFTPQNAWTALKQAETYLLGPLGMKTLDPEDWAYRGDYDNSNDSGDPMVSHGFNYHQGPEWVWPVGFFLRAKLHFSAQNGALKETLASTKLILSKHFTELQTSAWRGLPELTNSNGAYCRDSSRTQAWSMSCILEVLHDLQKIESSQTLVVN